MIRATKRRRLRAELKELISQMKISNKTAKKYFKLMKTRSLNDKIDLLLTPSVEEKQTKEALI